MRIAPEGWPVLIPLLIGCAVMASLAAWLTPGWAAAPIVMLMLALAAWGLWFFRDPLRTPPHAPPGHDLIISPADGRVIRIDRAPLPPELRGPATAEGASPLPRQRIAIFLNLFNVHVNRVPARGRIVRLAYVPGSFVNASFDKASTDNERSLALMIDPAGREIAFVQIAGLVARRIVNHLREGQEVALAERFGLIRFGSRAEVYLPEGAECRVRVGDRVSAGESILALMPAAVPTDPRTHEPALAGAPAGAAP
ncbi:MAG: phosphatidylserine decarboxylase [Phycisphaerales bacterium]